MVGFRNSTSDLFSTSSGPWLTATRHGEEKPTRPTNNTVTSCESVKYRGERSTISMAYKFQFPCGDVGGGGLKEDTAFDGRR